jgi:hypothetical protein
MNGRTVYSETAVTVNNNMTKTFILGKVPAGQYFLEVKNNDQKIVKKVMIN